MKKREKHTRWSIMKIKIVRWIAYWTTRVLYGNRKGVRKARQEMYDILQRMNLEILNYEKSQNKKGDV
jgi:hypothetical protein